MSNVVDSEGQIVIEPELRARLGVRAGWRARQVVAGDHLEVYFAAPENGVSTGEAQNTSKTPSLRGAAKAFMRNTSARELDWEETVSRSIAQECSITQEF